MAPGDKTANDPPGEKRAVRVIDGLGVDNMNTTATIGHGGPR